MSNEVFSGANGQITLEQGALTISRKGALGFLSQGLKGDKRIPYTSITAVQFKNAGSMTNGYIQFSMLGGVEARRGLFDATKDENTVMFTSKQESEFLALRRYVEERIENRGFAGGAAQPTSYAADLERLGGLLEKNLITREEFDAEKARLMGNGRTPTPTIGVGARTPVDTPRPGPAEEHEMTVLLAIGIFFIPGIFAWFTLRRGYSTLSRVVTFVWLGFVALIWITAMGSVHSDEVAQAPTRPSFVEETRPAPAPVQAETAPPAAKPAAAPVQTALEVQAAALAQAYSDNEPAAKQTYGGKTLRVTGRVTGVTLDFMDNPVIQMEGVNPFLHVQASFTKAYSARLSSVSKGSVVTVTCNKVTEVISAPMLDDCTI